MVPVSAGSLGATEKKWAPSSPGVGAGFDSKLGQKLYKAGLLLQLRVLMRYIR